MIPMPSHIWEIEDWIRRNVYLIPSGKNVPWAEIAHWDFARMMVPEEGWTLAHEVARYPNALPDSFTGWDWANKYGTTVAHEMMAKGNCEQLYRVGFAQWDLSDRNKWTIAHIAAENGIVIPGFHQWGLKTTTGRSVLFILCWNSFRLKKVVDVKSQFTDWDLVIDEEGNTCRDIWEKYEKERL